MIFLYIFPHPDDESFGPMGAMHQQLLQGHKVFLYTLTKGGATKQRVKLNLSIAEMGEIRYQEMLQVELTSGISGFKIDDFEDSGLQETDPRILEKHIEDHIHNIKPDIIVTYPVHGISGFHDHLVTHAVVKRVFVKLKEQHLSYATRLAFITLIDSGEEIWLDSGMRIKNSPKFLVDCIIQLNGDDINMIKQCLACYKTYKDTIDKSGIMDKIGSTLYFEIFNEAFDPPLNDLTENLSNQ